jgi:hypothetical protein
MSGESWFPESQRLVMAASSHGKEANIALEPLLFDYESHSESSEHHHLPNAPLLILTHR